MTPKVLFEIEDGDGTTYYIVHDKKSPNPAKPFAVYQREGTEDAKLIELNVSMVWSKGYYADIIQARTDVLNHIQSGKELLKMIFSDRNLEIARKKLGL
jgi:hypothetical protein